MWALQDDSAISIADGDPKMCEDGGALSIAERTNAEKIVGEGRHDMVDAQASGGQCWEVNCSCGG